MNEPTGWLYQYCKLMIKGSVMKYPNEKSKWLGNPGVNRMKLWALVLAKQGVITGDLKTLELSANDVRFDTVRLFGDSSEGCIWPWEVDRVARQVLEHNPQFDGLPAQRRALEGHRRGDLNLAPFVEKARERRLSRVQKPGQQETVVISYV